MPTLPSQPVPDSVTFAASSFGAKARSVNRKRSQRRSGSRPFFQFNLSYSDLDFDQRRVLEAFVLEVDGGMVEFDAVIPTYSENSEVLNSTANPDGDYSKGVSQITLTGITGELKTMNMLRVTGTGQVHFVVSASPNVSGSQDLVIKPRLSEDISTLTVFEIKDVSVLATLGDSSFKFNSKQMSSDCSLTLDVEV